MTTLPLKMKIAQLFRFCEALNPQAILELVQDQYPGETYCSLPVIENHLQSLKAVGILNEESSYLNDDGKLVSVYRISEYGLSKVEGYE
jgi:hypothetical protein